MGALLVAQVEAVVGPEHDDRDIGLFVRGKPRNRGQPLVLAMHQRGAGVGAVEDSIARVFDQHALQPAGEPGRLAVAEDDDCRRGRRGACRRARRFIGTHRGAGNAGEKKKPETNQR